MKVVVIGAGIVGYNAALMISREHHDVVVVETPDAATVRVRFSGPLCGGMQLSLSRSVLAELAGNMLGADDGSALSADDFFQRFLKK